MKEAVHNSAVFAYEQCELRVRHHCGPGWLWGKECEVKDALVMPVCHHCGPGWLWGKECKVKDALVVRTTITADQVGYGRA